MKMYVANCTRQSQDFIYTVPERYDAAGRLRQFRQLIPIGGQVELPMVGNAQEVQAVADQHAVYGMVRVDEIDRTRPFFGLCYSIDRQVNVDQLARAVEHNDEVLNQRGIQMRKEAAVALNNQLDEGMDPRLGKLGATEVSFEEREAKGQELGMGKQEVRVDKSAPRDGGAPSPARAGSRGGRGKRAA